MVHLKGETRSPGLAGLSATADQASRQTGTPAATGGGVRAPPKSPVVWAGAGSSLSLAEIPETLLKSLQKAHNEGMPVSSHCSQLLAPTSRLLAGLSADRDRHRGPARPAQRLDGPAEARTLREGESTWLRRLGSFQQ